MDTDHHARTAAGLLLLGPATSLILMLHHPTSLSGPDDGHLLGDWSNAVVHGGMIACLLAVAAGAMAIPRWLGDTRAPVRAGSVAFTAGVAALSVAALINGFAVGALVERSDNPGGLSSQIEALVVLNQTFAVFGMLAIAAAMAFWAFCMIRLRGIARVAGVVGLGGGVLAACWVATGGGEFGLLPATMATIVFAAWSGLTAACLIRGGMEVQ